MDVAELETLCRSVAPLDLAGVPVYVLPQSSLPPDRGGALDCGGCTSPTLDLILRDCLGGRWAGRGPAVVVNDVEAAADGPGLYRVACRSVVLHELAHVLARDRLYGEPTATPPGGWVTEGVSLFKAAAGSFTDDEEYTLAARLAHGPEFVRLACHLADRAIAERHALDLGLVLAGYVRADYPGYFVYAAALADELHDHADSPFSLIRTLPMPPAFLDLFGGESDG